MKTSICLFLLAITLPARLGAQPPGKKDSSKMIYSALLKEWQPATTSTRKVEGDNLVLHKFKVESTFPEVWAYYTAKLKFDQPYKPNLEMSTGIGSGSNAGSHSTIESAISTSDLGQTHCAILIYRDKKAAITIQITGTTEQKETLVTLIIEAK